MSNRWFAFVKLGLAILSFLVFGYLLVRFITMSQEMTLKETTIVDYIFFVMYLLGLLFNLFLLKNAQNQKAKRTLAVTLFLLLIGLLIFTENPFLMSIGLFSFVVFSLYWVVTELKAILFREKVDAQ